MTIVVTDTSPINYLVQRGCADVLGALFESVVIPDAVMRELHHSSAPEAVRRWANQLPPWAEVKACRKEMPALGLDPGETEAIALALELGIHTVIMDERKGRHAATKRGLNTIGTLALLELGDENHLLDFELALERLHEYHFRVSEELVAQVRQRIQNRKKRG